MSEPTFSALDYLKRLEAAQSTYLGYLKLRYADRTFPPFQLKLIDALDRLEKGTLGTDNLLITMPPRHGKSDYGTVNFPPYFIGRDPKRFVMSSSYNAILASDFGRQTRNLCEEHISRQIFPDLQVSLDSRASDVWSTTSGGRYFGVGLDGTTSGRPANLLIVDDPFKSREDADSAVMRNKVWNFYTSALTTRLQPTHNNERPRQIVILTRWHPDDLAGRIMQTEDWANGLWTHVNFEARSTAPDGKPVALWPERFNLDWLARRESLNPREFASLYQQTPFVEGGNLIKTEWFRRYHEAPAAFTSVIITCDTAFKTKERNDPSVIMVSGMDRHGDIYILDIIRAKLELHELKQRLIQTCAKWRGKGLRATYVEDKASGQSIVQELKRESGIAVIPHRVVHDKVARVTATIPIIEGGRVQIPDTASWLASFTEEVKAFPSAKHDDQIDALTMAIDIHIRTHISPDAWDGEVAAPAPLTSYGKSLRTNLAPHSTPFRGWGL